MTYTLQAGTTYILVFTTYSSNVMTPFSINVVGPTSVCLRRINITSTAASTSTMPTLTTSGSRSNVSNVAGVTTSYSSVLNSDSSTFTRNGGSGSFYYEALQVAVNTTGNYTLESNCVIDTYGYLYVNNFNPYDVSSNLVKSDDDAGGNFQFSMTYTLQAGTTYILVFTTYSSNVMTPFSVNVVGPTSVCLRRINITSAAPSTTIMPTLTITASRSNVNNVTGVTTSYSSILSSDSSTFTRNGSSGLFYYEAIQVTVNTTGNYTFRSNCAVDSYGYLYVNNFNAYDVSSNLVICDDDVGGNLQFLIGFTLQAGTTYILIFTTYSPRMTTPFTVNVAGPERLNLVRIYAENGLTSVNTIAINSPVTLPTSTAQNAVGCNGSNIQLTCPAQVLTNQTIVTVEPSNRTPNGGYFPPNNTFFNPNDSSRVSGYVQTLTVEYARAKLPTALTRIWVYGIIPILGGYMVCSQYLIPSYEISVSQSIQTYDIISNRINVFSGSYVGIGIEDGLASIATTSGTMALIVGSANLTSNILTRTPLYFRPDNSEFGVKLSYSIVT
ncbi:unnamed protein product [Rotaria sp. Silwood2]|nr:unnamed protein product [Rotaria sp. Silwood2]CAF3129177.1 unnamed protein product [Rotaria sp. Silwood2]